MNKKLLKTYTFWVAVASALFLLVQFIFKCFGIAITEEGYMAVIDGILGVFVLLGILTVPPTKEEDKQNETQTQQKEHEKQNIKKTTTKTTKSSSEKH